MLQKNQLFVFLLVACIGGCATGTPTSAQQPRDEGTVVTGSRIPVRGGTVQPTGTVGGDDYRDSQRVTTQINKQGN